MPTFPNVLISMHGSHLKERFEQFSLLPVYLQAAITTF